MPRSCLCSRLLARAAADAAFRLLPDGARLLWFEIMAMASAAPIPGRLRFLHSVPASVARLVSRSETDVASDLADLEALTMIERDPDGVTLWLPGVRANQARADAARRNGLKGGAARKGETKEDRRERRQGELLGLVQGGRATTQGTEAGNPAGTEGEEAHARAPDLPTHSVGRSVGEVTREEERSAPEAPAWVTLGHELAAIIGLNGANGGYDFSLVRGWLGAGVAPDIIRATVRRIVDRDPTQRRNLKYFDRAVLEHAEAAKHAPPPPRRETPEEAQARRDAEWKREEELAARAAAIRFATQGCFAPPMGRAA